MGGLFSMDGFLYKWGTEIADVMILSLLWILFSLPIFTIGASTSALFYVFGKKVRGEDPYVAKNFFKAFKDNFKQGTILTFILAVLWFSTYLYYKIIVSGQAGMVIKIIGILVTIQVIILSLYIFPVLSRFRLSVKDLILSSFMFGNTHIFTSISCLALFVVIFWFSTFPTPLGIFGFGIYAVLSSFLFQKVFTKYIEIAEEEENKKQEDGNINQIEGDINE